MRRIVFRAEAETDLREIIDYYNDIAPESVGNIVADIYRSIDLLQTYVLIGMQVPNRSYRRIVTIRYHFKIAYEVGEDRIIILGIFRFQNREGNLVMNRQRSVAPA
jgi:plasmid stabilization system protein ParE